MCPWPGINSVGNTRPVNKWRVENSELSEFVEPLLDRLRGELPKPNISALSSKT